MSDQWVRESLNQELYFWSMRRYKKHMAKIPEGRKPLPNEWFVDRAKQITPLTPEERQRSKERQEANTDYNRCVSCGNLSKETWCQFCIEEE